MRRYTVCAEPIPVVATITAAVIATSRHRFAIRSPLAQPIISVRLTFPRRVRIYPRAMLKDLRYALHIIAKDRWYSAVAVVALSLGIGLNATVFTLVNAILIRGLPYKDSAQLYMLSSKRQDAGQSNVSKLDLDDWRSQSKTFEALGAFNGNSVNVSDDRSAPENVRSAAITSNAFSLIAQQPVLGRDLLPGDEQTGAEPVVLLGYKLWKRRFAEDRGILGKTLRIDGRPATIVGVMPDGLDFPNSTELWVPLIPDEGQQKRDARFIAVFGRMRKDVSREQAQTEMNGIAQRLATAFPDTNKDYPQVSVQTFNERFNGGNIRTVMLAMMGAVGFVLLIACANVANLQLTRSVKRTREVAVRIALGATRWRVVRQLLVESVLLGILGGVIGFGIAFVGVRLFDAAVANAGKPSWIHFTFDVTVLAYLGGICILTGVVFGLAPALQVTRTNVNDVLKEGGRGSAGGVRARWMTGTMVVLELALTLVLLVGAGLMIRSFLKLYTLDVGIDTRNLVAMRMQLSDAKYKTLEARRAFYDRLGPKVEAIPGVEAATFTSNVPPLGAGRRTIDIDGRPPRMPEEKAPEVTAVTISPGFFRTANLQLHRGRLFTESDGMPGNETTIVSEKFAAQLFPGEDPIGRRIRFTPPQPRAGQPPPTPPVWRTIVGISPNVMHANPQVADPPPVIYLPHRQDASGFMTLLVRSRLDAGAIMNAVRREVAAVDPDQPVFTAQTLEQLLVQLTWPYRVFGSLFAIFAVIALVMSAVGLYAVMAYSVTQRTPEIGVRMALGAEGRQVSWLILRRGLIQMGIGLTLGLTGAFFLATVLATLLVQIPARDPVTFASISIILAIVALCACVFPARRATRVDPLVALRAE
ncbi:MAG TPA: ABC transporter permease [Vicinamibacterales bacterium]|nr:ABC transporter permease [Vicinamibacterales bacterium]